MTEKTHLKIVKPSTEAERATHTTSDTIEVTPNRVRAWKLPPFQRQLRVNDRVTKVVQDIKKSGVIPGIITLGVLDGETWLIDGQHRREAFLLAEIPVGYADIRVVHAKSMSELAAEFKALNSRLVNMRPDDFLKSMEPSSKILQLVRKRCSFVGYDMVRRNDRAPILSMSAVIRTWSASAKEVPTHSNGSATDQAEALSIDEAESMVDFLDLAYGAWGRDPEYARLWSALNLSICMWLYRRLVLGYMAQNFSARVPRLDPQQFGKCLMSLSADAAYLDWLVGRQASDRDRSPAYHKIKAAFAARLELDTGKKPLLPQPAWVSSAGGHKK